jgi:hypothetical protein
VSGQREISRHGVRAVAASDYGQVHYTHLQFLLRLNHDLLNPGASNKRTITASMASNQHVFGLISYNLEIYGSCSTWN